MRAQNSIPPTKNPMVLHAILQIMQRRLNRLSSPNAIPIDFLEPEHIEPIQTKTTKATLDTSTSSTVLSYAVFPDELD